MVNPIKLNDSYIESTVLGKIVAARKECLAELKKTLPLESFVKNLQKSDRSLKDALTANPTAFIMECKKASPSKGLIRPSFSPKDIAKIYDKRADAVSVLAEEKYFQGKPEYVKEARKYFHGPVIWKDFVIDPYQVYLARKNNADAILLMLSVLPDESYAELSKLAAYLGLDVLTEATSKEEVARAIKLGAQIIGINNRDLRDLTVNLDRVRELAPLIPEGVARVCESGIQSVEEVRSIAPLVNGFLVGSSLTSQPDMDMACRRLVYGENKVCGLTRRADAEAAAEAGATHGGMIFVPSSKRCISIKHASQVRKGVRLKFVGVFADAPADQVLNIQKELGLSAIQLHGNESPEYVQEIKNALPHWAEVWKAVPGTDSAAVAKNMKSYGNADRYLVDAKDSSGFGGTGKTFDWTMLKDAWKASGVENARQKTMLAGGLNPMNAARAAALGCGGLDFNSGLEDAPGKKNKDALCSAFAALRASSKIGDK